MLGGEEQYAEYVAAGGARISSSSAPIRDGARDADVSELAEWRAKLEERLR